ncbi:hypothetical protein LEP1GSC168_3040 [Leptospira santarosai str. HAI134]|uniref:Uncharacterized protein n=2 Tax=Leptospira santarosai TaxID=28183 RepID=M6UKM3_9LEPT|nr:hypothetical protein [Leptospira santarosai]EKT85718.1 hypothetical protein LSS_16341 [Leptospira santarosai serovar Shermani str. LT 821]EMO24182.1 hypothetical protein LEP1GSC168_3040 [Leptospira santarosai str. HAI134]EMO45075.1 hypothetical protein LEP1GSC187_1830 [Leptospira santarosai str. ZUN179]
MDVAKRISINHWTRTRDVGKQKSFQRIKILYSEVTDGILDAWKRKKVSILH